MVVAMGMTWCRLDRETAKRVFGECSDAERVLHAELVSTGAIAAHYDILKREHLRAMAGTCPAAPDSPAVEPAMPGVLSWVFAELTSPFRRTWSLSSSEAAFIASCLTDLIRISTSSASTPRDELISLRMRFVTCQWLLRRRCGRHAATA